jgi:hypothetical protein
MATYKIPKTAVAGCSYCGDWSDSPATQADVEHELLGMLAVYLEQEHGIPQGKLKGGDAIGPFARKIWLCYPAKVCVKARVLAEAWIQDHKQDTRLIHDAN